MWPAGGWAWMGIGAAQTRWRSGEVGFKLSAPPIDRWWSIRRGRPRPGAKVLANFHQT